MKPLPQSYDNWRGGPQGGAGAFGGPGSGTGGGGGMGGGIAYYIPKPKASCVDCQFSYSGVHKTVHICNIVNFNLRFSI